MTLDAADFMKLVQLDNYKLDSRMKNPKETHPQYKLERTYCNICGKPKGWVSQESSKYMAAQNIIVVCDDCCSQFGELPLEKADIKEL